MSPAESKATGPRTPEGKIKSSLNATRHGLTGRVVVLPSEDMNAYQAFCKELMAELAPATALERQFAQTFCDTQWRLNRARSYEDSMLALGHLASETNLNAEHPEVQAALAAGKQFRDHSKAFVNLSLYEQRLQRAQKEALRQLLELQTARKAARQAALDEAVALRNLQKMKGEPTDPATPHEQSGFVFSSFEIEREALRQHRQTDAHNARACGYNLTEYFKLPLTLAA